MREFWEQGLTGAFFLTRESLQVVATPTRRLLPSVRGLGVWRVSTS